MTKLKSKKMSKSTFAIIIMAIAMVAMLAFGGTYAYFTSSASGLGGTAYAAKIKLSASGDSFTQVSTLTKVLPTEKLFAAEDTLTITDESNRASYIFVSVKVEAFKKTGEGTYSATADSTSTLDLSDGIAISGGKTFASVSTGVYGFLTTDKENDSAYTGATFAITGLEAEIPVEWGNEYQEAKIVVTITVDSIQAQGFVDAAAAYTVFKTLENGVPPQQD